MGGVLRHRQSSTTIALSRKLAGDGRCSLNQNPHSGCTCWFSLGCYQLSSLWMFRAHILQLCTSALFLWTDMDCPFVRFYSSPASRSICIFTLTWGGVQSCTIEHDSTTAREPKPFDCAGDFHCLRIHTAKFDLAAGHTACCLPSLHHIWGPATMGGLEVKCSGVQSGIDIPNVCLGETWKVKSRVFSDDTAALIVDRLPTLLWSLFWAVES